MKLMNRRSFLRRVLQLGAGAIGAEELLDAHFGTVHRSGGRAGAAPWSMLKAEGTPGSNSSGWRSEQDISTVYRDNVAIASQPGTLFDVRGGPR